MSLNIWFQYMYIFYIFCVLVLFFLSPKSIDHFALYFSRSKTKIKYNYIIWMNHSEWWSFYFGIYWKWLLHVGRLKGILYSFISFHTWLYSIYYYLRWWWVRSEFVFFSASFFLRLNWIFPFSTDMPFYGWEKTMFLTNNTSQLCVFSFFSLSLSHFTKTTGLFKY